jgi:uncharacterized phage infection (PIP) family protein YhgE
MAENDMVDQNGHHDDLGARVGVQSQRIANLEGLFADLRRDMNQQIGNVHTAISSITSKMDERFTTMAATMAERNKTQWPVIWSAIGVSFAVLAYFMTQNLQPLKDNQTRFDQSLVDLSNTTNSSFQAIIEKMVSRQEMDWRAARGSEDRARTDKAVDDLRAVMLPRAEWAERNLSRDHDIENLRADAVRDVANLQRQIDLQRSDFQTFSSSLGNGRDFITDLKQEVARLRDQLAEIRSRQWQRFGSTSMPP